jgi:hypothetical protein
MAITIATATADRIEDLALILGSKKTPDASVCWRLSHRPPRHPDQPAGPRAG